MKASNQKLTKIGEDSITERKETYWVRSKFKQLSPWGTPYSMRCIKNRAQVENYSLNRSEMKECGATSNDETYFGRSHYCVIAIKEWYQPAALPPIETGCWSCLARELCWQFCIVWVPSQWPRLGAEPILQLLAIGAGKIIAEIYSSALHKQTIWSENLGRLGANPTAQL